MTQSAVAQHHRRTLLVSKEFAESLGPCAQSAQCGAHLNWRNDATRGRSHSLMQTATSNPRGCRH
jgi:hypothetical protein